MSADNGIYVLYTLSTEGVPEYRVAYANAIDNIYGEWSEVDLIWNGNGSAIKETFGESKVFNELTDALDFAEDLSHNYEYLEDGISVISEFQHLGYLFE